MIRRAAELFADLEAVVEARNEARDAVLVPQAVYEAKGRRRLPEWPRLVVDPW